jgi:hypothetical protein
VDGGSLGWERQVGGQGFGGRADQTKERAAGPVVWWEGATAEKVVVGVWWVGGERSSPHCVAADAAYGKERKMGERARVSCV